jgi:SAM-dependent methyltransferase
MPQKTISTVAEHYETHLGPIYVWMAGGIEHAVRLGANDIKEFLATGGYAVDLGAGFGMHTIPLAKCGYHVLAVDTSGYLLGELRRQCNGLEVDVAVADMLNFPEYMRDKADLVLCMGDTLTHLQCTDQVTTLMLRVASALRPGGRFVATFRDYRRLPTGADRFIPVRSDTERIHTCFLEEAAEHVLVHDVLHERQDAGWTMKVSSYKKLRLSPEMVVEEARAAGMNCHLEEGPRGMVKVRADA